MENKKGLGRFISNKDNTFLVKGNFADWDGLKYHKFGPASLSKYVRIMNSEDYKGHFFSDDSALTNRPDAITNFHFFSGFLPAFLDFCLKVT